MSKKSLKEKAISIQGKDYVMVKDRIIYFNEHFPNGSIETSYEYVSDIFIVCAIVRPDVNTPDQIFTGHSQARFEDGGAAATAPLEVAETSAIGRALACMGIGVLDSIASADEMNKAGVNERMATQKQIDYINNLIAHTGMMPDEFWTAKNTDPNVLTAERASKLIEELKGGS